VKIIIKQSRGILFRITEDTRAAELQGECIERIELTEQEARQLNSELTLAPVVFYHEPAWWTKKGFVGELMGYRLWIV
jgi:hypothetical protein